MADRDNTKTALEVGVVSTGIAGLAAGIAFHRAGHHVILYERSQLKNEDGAAITLTPNGNLVLDRWEFDADAAGATTNVQARRLDGFSSRAGRTIIPHGGSCAD